jgi:AcrR family transcriptional regulator
MAKEKKQTKTPKGEQTRNLILNTALNLLADRGYEKTTMRAIAQECGLSLGNAYHYFKSKEHLIQAFYQRTHEEHVAASLPVFEKERELKARLLQVLRLKIQTLEPYHEFAGVLFKTAADPHSPLNPFGRDASPVRRDSIQVFETLVMGAKTKLPADLKAELPYLLWLYHMGIILFWIHDMSPDRKRTHHVINRTVDLIDRLVTLASNPLLRPLRKKSLQFVAEIRDLELAEG